MIDEREVGDVYVLRSDGGVDGFLCSVNPGAGGHQGRSGRGRHFRVLGFGYD